MTKSGSKWIAISAALAVFSGTAAMAAESKPFAVTDQKVQTAMKDWPKTSKEAANAMIKKYGLPDEATSGMFVWNDNGPWKRTIVYGTEIQHNFPMPHKDVLEQFINLNVPADRFDELAAYDGSVMVERTAGEISARCDKEGANFLALNLAKEIIDGKKTVEEARLAYAENIQAMMQGKKPEMMASLQFDVPKKNVTNPDESIMKRVASK